MELHDFLSRVKQAPYYHREFGIPDIQNLSDSESSNIMFNDLSYFKFTFVRNPYDRLVSAYSDKVYAPTSNYYIYVAQKMKAEISWNPSAMTRSVFNLLKWIYRPISRYIPSEDTLGYTDVYKAGFPKTDIIYPENYNYRLIQETISRNYGKTPSRYIFDKIKSHLKTTYFDYTNIEKININLFAILFSEFVNYICNKNIKK
jgi:hypothetical protein